MALKVSLCLFLLSFSWSVTHHTLKPDSDGKNLIGSIRGFVEDAKGVINFGLVNFFAAKGFQAVPNSEAFDKVDQSIKKGQQVNENVERGQPGQAIKDLSPGEPDPNVNY